MKVIQKKNFRTRQSIEKILVEKEIMKNLKHRNILKLYKTFQTKEEVYLIIEYAEKGTSSRRTPKAPSELTPRRPAIAARRAGAAERGPDPDNRGPNHRLSDVPALAGNHLRRPEGREHPDRQERDSQALRLQSLGDRVGAERVHAGHPELPVAGSHRELFSEQAVRLLGAGRSAALLVLPALPVRQRLDVIADPKHPQNQNREGVRQTTGVERVQGADQRAAREEPEETTGEPHRGLPATRVLQLAGLGQILSRQRELSVRQDEVDRWRQVVLGLVR